MLITSQKVRAYSSSELGVMFMLKRHWRQFHLETLQN